MRVWVLALTLVGCGFSSPAAMNSTGDDAGDQGSDGSDGGAGSDAGSSSSPIHVCLGTFVKVCADAPRGSLNLMTGTIDTSDTSASSKCLPRGAYTIDPDADACVIASQTIAVPANNTVSVTGTRRLILLADETLTIAGTLDVASHRKGMTGPAADTGPCPTNFTNPTTATQGGGSWGGTLAQPGNSGGSTPDGGIGGIQGSAVLVTAFGGGCPGGNGAGNSANTGGGSGGHGGGAALLLAGQIAAVSGTVNASGAGGNGGKARGGGGGGGTGGMIVVEAPMVRITGKCFANGGGGGQGGNAGDGDGGDESNAPDNAADGGKAFTPGGTGGAGGVGTTGCLPGSDGGRGLFGDTGGGGAGGGAVGVIKIVSPDPGTTSDLQKVSPPPG
ncbi:MAG TPA: hypothetical protein VHW23_26205 [Kofleriaceae bacterium]|nr:hypothetical protein [Kofleriaceae bacterium]